MIFGRKKKADQADDAPAPTERDETAVEDDADVDTASDAEETVDVEVDDDVEEDAASPDDAADDEVIRWRRFDTSTDWRADGPFDLDEVDLDADEVDRLDLGALVVTPIPGSELRLQMAEPKKQIVSALMVSGDSAMEMSVFAAPRTPGLWSEIRGDIIARTEAEGGTAECVEGPFGTELRRSARVKLPDGKLATQPTRTWVAEGPRWLLRGVLYGKAAMSTEHDDDLVGPFFDAFSDLVVRRGEEPRPSGDVLALEVPEHLKQQAAAKAAAEAKAKESEPQRGPIGEGGVMGVARQG